MKRTAIKQQNSLTMTLPKKWVAQHGILPSNELSVDETEDGALIIRAGLSQVLKSTSVSLEKHTTSRLRTLLAGLYRRGYDKITLTSKQEFSLAGVEKLIQTLTGLQIVTFSSTRIELECTATNPGDLQAYVTKFFVMAAYVCKSQGQLKDEDLELFRRQSLELRDFICRSVHRTGFGAEKQTEYQLLTFFLEKFVSALTRAPPTKRISSFASHIESLRAALLSHDVAIAQRINEELSGVLKLKLTPHELLLCDHLFSISSRVLSIVV